MVFVYLLCGKILMMMWKLFFISSLAFAQQSLNSFEPLPRDLTLQPVPTTTVEKQTVKTILKDSTEKLKQEKKDAPAEEQKVNRPSKREKKLTPPAEVEDYEKTHGVLPSR